jgi:hypothetical protein
MILMQANLAALSWEESVDNMLIREVADSGSAKLLGLAEFLLGRAGDTNAPKQISMPAFVKMAQEIGVPVTPQSLAELVNQAPLSNVIEPIEPGSNVIRFKGSGSDSDVAMPVDRAQDVVASAAKRAAAKRT